MRIFLAVTTLALTACGAKFDEGHYRVTSTVVEDTCGSTVGTMTSTTWSVEQDGDTYSVNTGTTQMEGKFEGNEVVLRRIDKTTLGEGDEACEQVAESTLWVNPAGDTMSGDGLVEISGCTDACAIWTEFEGEKR